MSGFDSVGTLLADIANLLVEGLRIFTLADKRHWRQDEYEQVRALEEALNEAKRDFQDLCPLVNGQAQYEHDRKCTCHYSDISGIARDRNECEGC
jgi:hypothetical protein